MLQFTERRRAPPVRPQAQSASNHVDRTVVPRRVLIVEDNLDTGRSFAYLLRDEGHHVEHAINGYSALTIASQMLPEVVFLDIGLPGIDGLSVARALRAQPGLEKIRIVVVSAYARDEYRDRAREAGCDLYLVKPVHPRDLARLLA